jgi:hypothetical protein
LGERLQKKETDQMNLSKSISMALAALVLVVLAGTGSAFAQTVTFSVGTAPTEVANTGRSEVMGQLTNTAGVTCSPGGIGAEPDGFCVSTAGTIQVTYDRTPIDNTTATGITVCETIAGVTTCNAPGTYLTTGAVTVTPGVNGGVVSFGVNGGVDFQSGDQLIISGVRGQIDLSGAGIEIRAILTTSPSTIASFSPTNEVVARPKDPLTIAFGAWTILQCRPTVGTGKVTVTEGFSTAFVDHGDITEVTWPGAPLNPRPLFGGTNNSRINIVLTGLPTGVTVNWPLTSAADSGPGLTTARLDKIVQDTRGTTVTYVYGTPNQAPSDVSGEIFVITVTAAANVLLTGTPTDFGSSTGQGQMFPPALPVGVRPRYNHPLEDDPGKAWLTVAPCTTNLLFPWVIQVTPGLDTGIAISNTSMDPYGTITQTGTCALNLYPTDLTTTNGVSGGGVVTLTTTAVAPGSVWRAAMSGVASFAGKGGYIISVCNFQYGHGFAYITDNFSLGAPNTAQGYVALIIPDPVILGGAAGCGVTLNPAKKYRSAAVAADDVIGGKCIPYGEGLAQ